MGAQNINKDSAKMVQNHAAISDSTCLVEIDGVMTISSLDAEEIIIHERFHYSPDDAENEVIRALDAVFETLKEKKYTKVLVITSDVKGAFSPTVFKFINEIQFPRLLGETSIKYIATVVSEDEVKETNAKLWKAQLAQDTRLVMANVHSPGEGINWLRQF